MRRTRSILSLATLAAAVLAGASCTAPSPATPAYHTCPTAAAGQAQVAVVVDGAPDPATRVVCVVVADGATGLDALVARAQRIGGPAPRTQGGFVCGIDGTPAAPECAPSTPDGYRYWNYWLGGSSWSTSPVGAASHVVHQGSVEGWVFGTWDFVTTFPPTPAASPAFSALTA